MCVYVSVCVQEEEEEEEVGSGVKAVMEKMKSVFAEVLVSSESSAE